MLKRANTKMKSSHTQRTILVIGISGHLAQLTCKNIIKDNANVEIIGIDNRYTIERLPKQVHVRKVYYSRSYFEKIFRENKFDTIYHLGRISHAQNTGLQSSSLRMNFNLLGTKIILDLAIKYHISKFIFLSTFHVYGAYSDNSIYLNEESDLRASLGYPQLRDVVEMDQIVNNWMWKHQDKIETIILRPCNIVGSKIRNTITTYLTSKMAPVPMDFNPSFQFIHEEDLAEILKLSDLIETGVYNCCMKETISLNEAHKIIGIKKMHVPIFIFKQIFKILHIPFYNIPTYLIDYLMYPCIIDSTKLQSNLKDFKFKYDIKTCLQELKN